MPNFEMKLTPAVLRIAAREAQTNMQWRLAASLYDQAADGIPASGTLNVADIDNLRRQAKSCRTMEVRELYPDAWPIPSS